MGLHRLPLLALLAGVAGAPLSAQSDPAGTWVGQWERDGSVLEVEVTFTRAASGLEGSFSSAGLRVVGIPFQAVRHEATRLSWELAGDSTTAVFEGILEGDTLAGGFREDGATGTFRLARTAAPRVPLEEEELHFANGEVTLAGTVVYPTGPGPFPGIVLLHGSGAEGRWASRYLANELARRGVAALIFDKRGVGGSGGDWRGVGFAELVGDASAAVEALRSRPRIAPDRVGIHGHSQGGTLAPWVATENRHVAFVVASAAAGLPMAETEVFSVGNSIGVDDLAPEERQLAERFVRALVATAYEGAPREEMLAAWEAVRDRPWAFEPPAESSHYWSFSRRIASYDALAHWRRVAVPALLVYGEEDERVPPRPSAQRIAEAYLGSVGSRLEVVLFPGADHTFRLQPANQGSFEWPRTVSGYPSRVIDWILEQVARP
jgi:pimeloyl-ACP methyl ester carboxylesterase